MMLWVYHSELRFKEKARRGYRKYAILPPSQLKLILIPLMKKVAILADRSRLTAIYFFCL